MTDPPARSPHRRMAEDLRAARKVAPNCVLDQEVAQALLYPQKYETNVVKKEVEKRAAEPDE